MIKRVRGNPAPGQSPEYLSIVGSAHRCVQQPTIKPSDQICRWATTLLAHCQASVRGLSEAAPNHPRVANSWPPAEYADAGEHGTAGIRKGGLRRPEPALFENLR